MHTYQLAIYTASDIVMEAVPFLVEGRVNRIIPKALGIYVLLHDTSIQYVGKTCGFIRNRLQAYKADAQFTHVWWHQVEASWADVYELLYLRDLHPPLNGTYHRPPTLVSWQGQWCDADGVSPSAHAKYEVQVQQEIDQAVLAS